MWRIITLVIGNDNEIYLPLYKHIGKGILLQTDRWLRMEKGRVTHMTKAEVVNLILERQFTRQQIYLMPNEEVRLSERLQNHGCLLYNGVKYVCAIIDPENPGSPP